MMKTLLRNQRKIMMNSIRTMPRKNLFASLFGFTVIAAVLLFLSNIIWAESGAITDSALHALLSYVFLMIIGFIVIAGVPQIFKNLYESTDLEMLFTMPIPTRNIFWMKYIQGFIGVPLFVYVVFVVPLLVYGFSTGANFLYYPVVMITLFAITIIALSITYLLNLIIIQMIPASRANELMTTISVLSGVVVYLTFMLPRLLSDKPITELIMSGLPILPKWVPISWGSSALLEAKYGSAQFIIPLLLIIILAIIFFLLATSLVEKGFRTGWIRLSEGGAKKKQKRKKADKSHLTHPVIAIGKKEWLAIKRDAREWIVLMPFMFFIIFGLIGFFTSGAEFGEIAKARNYPRISWAVAQGILLFLYTMSMATISSSSIGREGASIWILKVFPLSGRQIALGKLWISWLLPFVILTTIEIVAGIALGWALWQFAIGIFIKALITMGMSALGLWLGTIGGRYNPMNPQARLTGPVTILMLGLSVVHLVVIAVPHAFLFIPMEAINLPPGSEHGQTGFTGVIATIWLAILSWRKGYPLISFSIGFIVLVIFTLAIAYMFFRLSARNIDRGLKIDMVSETSAKPLFGKKKSSGSLY